MSKKFFIELDKQLALDTIERIKNEFCITFVGEPKKRKFAKNLSDVGTARSRELYLQEAKSNFLCEKGGKLYYVRYFNAPPVYIGKSQVGVLDDDKKAFATVVWLNWDTVLRLL